MNESCSNVIGGDLIPAVVSSLRTICQAGSCPRKRHESRYALYDLASKEMSPSQYESLLRDPEICQLGMQCADWSAGEGIREECEIAALLLSGPLSYQELYERYYGKTYSHFAQSEHRFLENFGRGFRSGDQIAFIGAGALPVSALVLANEFNLHVVAVDSDEESCSYASQIIEKLDMSSRVSVMNCLAEELDVSPYSKVVCANWLRNLDRFILNLKEAATSKSFIFRDARPRSCSFCINKVLDKELCQSVGLQLLGSVYPPFESSLISRVFVPGGGSSLEFGALDS